jgi:Flp pilus assembly pilin Flp
MRKSQKGTSVSEYALIGGLVVIVGIGTLSVLGQNVSSMFSNTIVSKRTVQAAATPALSNPSSPLLLASPFQAGTGVSDIAISVTNKNGQPVNLSIPNYPFDKAAIAKDIEVSGSDATTKKLALMMEQIAQMLLTNNVIDSDEADLLRSMSGAGFSIANLQKEFNTKIANAKKGGTFDNPPSEATKFEGPLGALNGIYETLKSKPFMQQPNIAALIDDSVKTIQQSAAQSNKFSTEMIYHSQDPSDPSYVSFNQLFSFIGGEDLNQRLSKAFTKTAQSSSNLCNLSATGQVSGLNCVNRAAPAQTAAG